MSLEWSREAEKAHEYIQKYKTVDERNKSCGGILYRTVIT